MADEPWSLQAINDRLRKTVEDQSRRLVSLEEENAHLKSEIKELEATLKTWDPGIVFDEEDE